MRICTHFGRCGGCATQDLPYAEEVRRKEAALHETLGREVVVEPSPREFGTRTRMDYVFAWGKLGLRKKGDPRGVLDLEECLLPDARAFAAVLEAKRAIAEIGLRSYSYLSHKGYLRYVTVRCAPVTGQLMLVFLTNGTDPAVRPLLDRAEAWADSVVWSASERTADISAGDLVEVRGRDWIEEQVGDLRLRYGPNSFFQTNPWQTARLYEHVARRARGTTTDLYCGVGGLALAAALGDATAVVGCDSNEEGIAFARHNAKANGLAGRAEFVAADVKRFLPDHRCDTLILDPPRGGLGFKNVRKAVRAQPARILYVSCNPKALAAELGHFAGYELTELRGFDLFPKTAHCEVVATLDRA